MNDTSAKAREVYFRRLSEMTPTERLAIGIALCQSGDALQRSVMNRRYPQADDAQICLRIAATRFGIELAHKAYGIK